MVEIKKPNIRSTKGALSDGGLACPGTYRCNAVRCWIVSQEQWLKQRLMLMEEEKQYMRAARRRFLGAQKGLFIERALA
jgi:hypothetical protein